MIAHFFLRQELHALRFSRTGKEKCVEVHGAGWPRISGWISGRRPQCAELREVPQILSVALNVEQKAIGLIAGSRNKMIRGTHRHGDTIREGPEVLVAL